MKSKGAKPARNPIGMMVDRAARLTRFASLQEQQLTHFDELCQFPRRYGYATVGEFLEAVEDATGYHGLGRRRKLRTSVLRLMAKAGFTGQEIADELGVAPQSVFNRCSASGIRLSSGQVGRSVRVR